MLRDYSELIIHSFNKNGRGRYQESSKNTINNNNNNDNKQYEISKQIESINLARLSRFSFTLTPNYTLLENFWLVCQKLFLPKSLSC